MEHELQLVVNQEDYDSADRISKQLRQMRKRRNNIDALFETEKYEKMIQMPISEQAKKNIQMKKNLLTKIRSTMTIKNLNSQIKKIKSKQETCDKVSKEEEERNENEEELP